MPGLPAPVVDMPFHFQFPRSVEAKAVTALLILQLAGLYALSRAENAPNRPPLSEFPHTLAGWSLLQEGVVEKEVQEVLKADDLLNRSYLSPDKGQSANLFIAYFQSQRTGKAPHSPKNCLPGSGWMPVVSDTLAVSIFGQNEPIYVNRYVVAKGEQKSLVLYWYQSHKRVIASEYKAKLYQVIDSIRYNRSDTALVRVVIPVAGDGVEGATKAAIEFVRSFFDPLQRYLPA